MQVHVHKKYSSRKLCNEVYMYMYSAYKVNMLKLNPEQTESLEKHKKKFPFYFKFCSSFYVIYSNLINSVNYKSTSMF